MSIAMSITARPSGAVLWCMALTAAVAAFCLVVVVGQYRQQGGWPAGASVYGVFGCCVACLALTLYNYRLHGAWRAGSRRLDISASGEMRLTDHVSGSVQSMPVQLMSGSTLWSFFMLLRLRGDDRKVIVLPFFSTSLAPVSFRRLSVACRWIAARNRPAATADAGGRFGSPADQNVQS